MKSQERFKVSPFDSNTTQKEMETNGNLSARNNAWFAATELKPV